MLLFLDTLTLLEPTQSADDLFHSFTIKMRILKYLVYTAFLLM